MRPPMVILGLDGPLRPLRPQASRSYPINTHEVRGQTNLRMTRSHYWVCTRMPIPVERATEIAHSLRCIGKPPSNSCKQSQHYYTGPMHQKKRPRSPQDLQKVPKSFGHQSFPFVLLI